MQVVVGFGGGLVLDPSYSPGVYSRLSVASLFVQEQEDFNKEKNSPTKGQGQNLKSEKRASRAGLKACFLLPHVADCCSGRLSRDEGPWGVVSGTHSPLKG